MTTRPVATVCLAPMGRADLPRVLAIEAETSSRPWSDAAFRAELAREDRRYLVARSVSPALGHAAGGGDGGGGTSGGGHAAGGGGATAGGAGLGGEVLGFAGVALFPDEAHVMTLAVDPESQGRGIGARLVAGMLAQVASAGLEAVTLEVGERNLAARRLYRRAGFEDAGVRPRYYPDGEGAVIMWSRRGVEVS
jgi:[ribosomal protein S18]-alanine N-acetyltransferase